MKFFIAGVDFDSLADHPLLIKRLINQIPTILHDAQRAMGNDVIIVIALHEYALTYKAAISHTEKKTAIQSLISLVTKHKNLILVPGSLAAYKDVTANTDKMDKIFEKYQSLMKLEEFKNDAQFKQEYDKFFGLNFDNYLLKKTIENFQPITNYDHIYYLENATYVITKNGQQKHKKSYPWNELTRFTFCDTNIIQNMFFNIGYDHPVKRISIGNRELDFGVLICRELSPTTVTTELVKKSQPFILGIISSSVEIVQDRMYGAINFHMDSNTKLNIFVNPSHALFHEIEQIEGKMYTIKIGDPGCVVTNVSITSLHDETTSTTQMDAQSTGSSPPAPPIMTGTMNANIEFIYSYLQDQFARQGEDREDNFQQFVEKFWQEGSKDALVLYPFPLQPISSSSENKRKSPQLEQGKISNNNIFVNNKRKKMESEELSCIELDCSPTNGY